MMKKPRNWSLKIYLISVLENKKLVVLVFDENRGRGIHLYSCVIKMGRSEFGWVYIHYLKITIQLSVWLLSYRVTKLQSI